MLKKLVKWHFMDVIHLKVQSNLEANYALLEKYAR